MCGICGAIDLRGRPVAGIARRLEVMSALIEHRGPDDDGVWIHPRGHVGVAHRRLAIIDPDGGRQPMIDEAGRCITYNGEVYNYRELRRDLGAGTFRGGSDTEVVLRAWARWGPGALQRLRGMFAFAIWDEQEQELVCVRDRLGIKPLYHAEVDGVLHFASEAKALLPMLPSIGIDLDALKDYLAFQFCLAGKTLFKGIRELPAAHLLRLGRGPAAPARYWDVHYDLDQGRGEDDFVEAISSLLAESVGLHLRSDVPVSTYLSGGLDSSTVTALAQLNSEQPITAFTGTFPADPTCDESQYARALAASVGVELCEVAIGVHDFADRMQALIYHLDYPAAGPGSLPQYVVSETAARECKVILGGQGGDEVFGGYARYLIAYFEQCIKAAIDGTAYSGNFVVSYESIIPNLGALREYKPLLQELWREGLFGPLDERYFRLIHRGADGFREVNVDLLGDYSPFETFREIFNASNVAGHEPYFDKMTHFDFKTLLPALLQVEDRVSMAHGLESRVPLLDHRLVELAATIPADVKFKDGEMKHVFRSAVRPLLPARVAERRRKMGFPVPLNKWLRGAAGDFARDLLSSDAARGRELFDNQAVLDGLEREPRFGRRTWGFLSLELWQQAFHDRAHHYMGLYNGGMDTDEDRDHGRGRVHRLPSRRSAAG